jgi:hypothetical protein
MQALQAYGHIVTSSVALDHELDRPQHEEER